MDPQCSGSHAPPNLLHFRQCCSACCFVSHCLMFSVLSLSLSRLNEGLFNHITTRITFHLTLLFISVFFIFSVTFIMHVRGYFSCRAITTTWSCPWSCPKAVSFFGIVQQPYIFFASSPKWWKQMEVKASVWNKVGMSCWARRYPTKGVLCLKWQKARLMKHKTFIYYSFIVVESLFNFLTGAGSHFMQDGKKN